MLELIDRTADLGRQVLEPDPDQEGTADVVALDAGLAALAALQPGHLFAFTVQLLNFPAEATRLLCRLSGGLSGIVGYDPVRAVGGHLDPEQAHLVVFKETLDLDGLAVRQLGRTPDQRVHPLIRPVAAGIIHLAVVFERTVIDLLQGFDEQHQLLGGIPGVHQHGAKRQPLVMAHVRQHVMDVIELGFAVPIGIIEAVIDEPELIGRRIDVDAGHDADTLDHGFGIATPLPADQLNPMGVLLVQDRVVEEEVARRGRHKVPAHVVPNQSRSNSFIS